MAESSGASRRRVSEKDIFLSHSGQEKPFVEQLFQDLKRAKQNAFFDQDTGSLPKAEKFAQNVLDAAEQCRMGVVVLSPDYLVSLWPMLELSKIVESMKTSNPGLKLFPLFFMLSPSDLNDAEVEKLKRKWEKIVRRRKMKEEVVELWSAAVKELRSWNGLDFSRFGKSEHKYRSAVVHEICKVLPPILKWKTDNIQGYERLCKTASSMFRDNEACKYLGLYGMGGVGKSTLCKAMCSYFQHEFGADVFLVELTSDQPNERLAEKERLARLLQLIQQIAAFDRSIPEHVSSEEQGWECLKMGLERKPRPIFLAIDNVGDLERSREEARSYLEAGLPPGSKVLVTSRSEEILEAVLGDAEYCKPIPRLEHDEAAKLFLSKAAPKKKKFNDEETEIVERCLRECQFTDNGYSSAQYHPLILRALGTYFHDVNSRDVLSWREALESKNKLQRSREVEHVNFILGLNYYPLSDEMKLVFLDSALYPYYGYAPLPWWSTIGKRSDYDLWVSWISEVHANTSLSDARKMLKDLQRLSLLEVSSIEEVPSLEEPYAHDLYKEFARVLVEKEGTKEWEWWMSREELGTGNAAKLKRVVLEKNKSLIGRSPWNLQEWQSVVFLELIDCNDCGTDNILELGGLYNLRVLALERCEKLKRIICNCYKYMHTSAQKSGCCRGCMSELHSVKLQCLDSLEDISFLRHCSNIQTLRVLDCNGSIYPTTRANFDSPGVLDLQYLKKLHTFIVSDGRGTWDEVHGDIFTKWLYSVLRLEKLVTFEHRSYDRRANDDQSYNATMDRSVRSYIINLNKAGLYTSNLSVLSLCIPKQIREIKGLHLLPELTTLNLSWCQGLEYVDIQNLPNLRHACIYKCCLLNASAFFKSKVQAIGDFLPTGFLSINHIHQEWMPHECLRSYCKETVCCDCTQRKQEGSSKRGKDFIKDTRQFKRAFYERRHCKSFRSPFPRASRVAHKNMNDGSDVMTKEQGESIEASEDVGKSGAIVLVSNSIN